MEWIGIAVFHGIPVYLAAALTESKRITVVVALVMAVIAVAFGNVTYSFIDIVAVLIGYLVGVAKIDNLQSKRVARNSIKRARVPRQFEKGRDDLLQAGRNVEEGLASRNTLESQRTFRGPQTGDHDKSNGSVISKDLYTGLVEGMAAARIVWPKSSDPKAVVGCNGPTLTLTSCTLFGDGPLAFSDHAYPDNYVFVKFFDGENLHWRSLWWTNRPIGVGWVDGYEVEVLARKDYFSGDEPYLALERKDHSGGWSEAREESLVLANALRDWDSSRRSEFPRDQLTEKEWLRATNSPRAKKNQNLHCELLHGDEMARVPWGASDSGLVAIGSGQQTKVLDSLQIIDDFTYGFFDSEFSEHYVFYRRFKAEDDWGLIGRENHIMGLGWVDGLEAIVVCRKDDQGVPYLSMQRENHGEDALISVSDRRDAARAHCHWTSTIFAVAPFPPF